MEPEGSFPMVLSLNSPHQIPVCPSKPLCTLIPSIWDQLSAASIRVQFPGHEPRIHWQNVNSNSEVLGLRSRLSSDNNRGVSFRNR
jgi:hypothetical protein